MNTNLPINQVDLNLVRALYATAKSSSDSSMSLKSVDSVVETISFEEQLSARPYNVASLDLDSISSYSESVASTSPIIHEVPYDPCYFGSLVFSVIPNTQIFAEVKQFVDDCHKSSSLCKQYFPSLNSEEFHQYFFNTLRPEILTIFSNKERKKTLLRICNGLCCSDVVYNVIFFFVEAASIVLKEDHPDLDLASMKLVLKEAAISSLSEIKRQVEASGLRNAHFQSLGLLASKLSIRGTLCSISNTIQTWDRPSKERFNKILQQYMQGSRRTDIARCSKSMQDVFEIFCDVEKSHDLKKVVYAHIVHCLSH